MEFGSPDTVSYVPGNHDAYVPIPFENGLAHFADYMQGDMRSGSMVDGLQFPYVRLRRNIALIGLNTGQPQALHRASGTLGAQQLRDLALALDDLKQRGYCRVVLIHHPPLPGMTPDRRALTDAQGFADVLKSSGAEMVLFGHNHQLRADYFDGPSGRIPVLGVSSASMRPIAQQEAAAWRLFSIDRAKGKWQIRAMERKWSEETQSFATIAPFSTVN
jgi:3',5'-cyclic AMP phosphodiesterase CpdA